MDYEVFLLSRVHEAWIETGDPHRAVAVGIGATARVITTAAAIMVVVFASFVLSTDPTVKMLAIGMAFAVLIDASLVRMILVPSIMALLDARAWWMPRWMEPIVPQLQLEGSVVEPEPVPAPSEPESAPVAPVSVSADGSASAPASSDRSAAASAPSDGSKPALAPSDGPAPASAPGREAAAARREPTEQ
jgi:RND superfamily putative drug exporter